MKFLSVLLLTLALLSVAFAYGGYKATTFNPESDPIDKLALEALLTRLSEADSELKITGILSCETQVVSGKNYFLRFTVNILGRQLEYDANIYVVPWEQRAEVTSLEMVQKQTIQPSTQQRQLMDGGRRSFNWYSKVSEDTISTSLKSEISDLIVQKLKTLDLQTEFQVLSAQSQVVSGVNYYLNILVGQQQYEVVVYSQIWNSILEISSFQEVDHSHQYIRRSTLNEMERQEAPKLKQDDLPTPQKSVGSFKPINFDQEDEQIKKLVFEIVASKLGGNGQITVTSAQRSVVNGLLYDLEFTYQGQSYTTHILVVLYEKRAQILDLIKH